MISKELLSEVLGSPVENISFDKNEDCEVRHGLSFENHIDGVSYTYIYGNQESRFMPIHELAHKCKGWASSRGFRIVEHLDKIEVYSATKLVLSQEGDGSGWYHHDNVFKACQWILENENQ